MARLLLPATLVLAALLWPLATHAQDGHRPEDAGAAYDRGVQAHSRGDLAEAARLFAEADALAPNDTALQAAIDAAVQADDPVLAMTLVDRAMKRPMSPAIGRAVDEAKSRFSSRTGRVIVNCTGPIRCEASIGDRVIPTGEAVWLLAGSHALEARFGDQKLHRNVDVAPGSFEQIELEAPKAAPTEPILEPAPKPVAPPPARAPVRPEPPSESVFASPWFWIGAGLTATLAGVSAWSAHDLASQHDTFVTGRCDEFGSPACEDAASDGKRAQLRTNLLIGATALAGAATLTVVLLPTGSPSLGEGEASRPMPVLTARGVF